MRKLTPEELSSRRRSANALEGRARRAIFALADNVRSMHNVGAIFRTADGAGVAKLYLCGITACPPRAEIRKTSLGAEEAVPWEYVPSAAEAVAGLKAQGVQIVVLEHTDSSYDFRRAPYRFPLCLVVGHEYHGVSEEVVALADIAVEIPMAGVKESLNVSVAFGIAVYEIARHCDAQFDQST
ncbi:MAG: RNA methyltransferase [candidate division KSB1 bacterium]|nr:RNA methyltransferase [candidate division KSB1 bacterium]MDZ7294978.1 RNA methyltransferase [candidate division KSB1 bacterium]MDZ7384908.1 RNA methyltransferase [candidate division KSB1 bacterium]MDZ7391962.1 RNA methyltransferase [candidate division KSB1 bacterium]MDZ7412037.1 RNA methyltransferase [candidate division KSB1 bacterium]